MADPIVINERYTIPAGELSWRAVRASGPGGQNVNKVSSKVELRFQLVSSTALPAAAKKRLRMLARGRVTLDGELVIVASENRDQARNLAAARERLRALVLDALTPPRPRKKTRPSKGSVERRLRSKRAQSERKSERRGGGHE